MAREGLQSGDIAAMAATVTAVAALAVAVWDDIRQRELPSRRSHCLADG